MGASIVIPVYNKLENLISVLKTLDKQITSVNYEVIISDDGSERSLYEEVKKISKEKKYKMKYIYQEDLGFRAGQARNNGILKCNYENIIFLDQDIIVSENFVEKIFLSMKKEDLVIYKTVYISEKEKKDIIDKIGEIAFNKLYDYILPKRINRLKKEIKADKLRSLKNKFGLRKKGAHTFGIFAVKKEILYKINGFDEEFSGYGYEDIEFSNRFYNNGYKSKVLDIKTIHLYHPNLKKTEDEALIKNQNLLDKKIKQKRAIFGLDNRKDKDKYIYEELN